MFSKFRVSKRHVLLFTVAAALYFSLTSASAQEELPKVHLQSAPNFRDLAGILAQFGGTGFADTTTHGGVMRTGVFYRTDALNNLNTKDWNYISSLGIVRDIDLRTPDEINGTNKPPAIPPARDIVPEGAVWTNINIYGTKRPQELPFGDSPARAVEFMRQGYQEFVSDKTQRDGIRDVLLTLAHDSGPDLWHCSGGKDRTGWVAAMMQSIAGVSQATIMKDYLATDSYTADALESNVAKIVSAGYNRDTAYALLGVEPGYLQAGLDEVTTLYGSMYGYLTRGLGLSQADIYVLRARMVYYSLLPGQAGFSGNAAAGAAFLNALQNSPLSGHYTAYNYYLQSAVDAGTLGGVQTQVGGQVHADAASFLLRRPEWIDDAIRPYTNGRVARQGQPFFWITGLGGGFWSNGGSGVTRSTETGAGTLLGATFRFNAQTAADLGLGYDWGEVGSAGADAVLDTVLGTIGGRCAFSALEAGPYMTARFEGGWVQYDSTRNLGGGLGIASGSTNGALYSGLAGLGDVMRLAPFTVTAQAGVRVTNASLDGFKESGSELALGVSGIDQTYVSLPLDLYFSLDSRLWRAWTVTPAFYLGYERILDNPRVESTGTLEGFGVSQFSAFDGHDLFKAGLNLTARHDNFLVKAGVNGLAGDGSGSAGVAGHLSLSYTF